MRYFPFYIDCEAKTILIVGGGAMASAKLRLLARTPAQLRLVAPEFNRDFEEHFQQDSLKNRIERVKRRFRPKDCRDVSLALVATGDKKRDAQIAKIIRKKGIWVAAIDQPAESDFITPAIIDRAPFSVALSTEGLAPVLARHIKAQIEAFLPENIAILTRKAGGLRPLIASHFKRPRERRRFWEQLFGSEQKKQWLANQAETPTELPENLAPEISGGRLVFINATENPDEKTGDALFHADIVIYDRHIARHPKKLLERARREALFLAVGNKIEHPDDIQNYLVAPHRKNMTIIRLLGENNDDIREHPDWQMAIGLNLAPEFAGSDKNSTPHTIFKTDNSLPVFLPPSLPGKSSSIEMSRE